MKRFAVTNNMIWDQLPETSKHDSLAGAIADAECRVYPCTVLEFKGETRVDCKAMFSVEPVDPFTKGEK